MFICWDTFFFLIWFQLRYGNKEYMRKIVVFLILEYQLNFYDNAITIHCSIYKN